MVHGGVEHCDAVAIDAKYVQDSGNKESGTPNKPRSGFKEDNCSESLPYEFQSVDEGLQGNAFKKISPSQIHPLYFKPFRYSLYKNLDIREQLAKVGRIGVGVDVKPFNGGRSRY